MEQSLRRSVVAKLEHVMNEAEQSGEGREVRNGSGNQSAAARVRGERIAACAEEINLILEKYRCKLSPVVLIAGGQIQMRCEVESM